MFTLKFLAACVFFPGNRTFRIRKLSSNTILFLTGFFQLAR